MQLTYSGNHLSVITDNGAPVSMMGDAFHFVDGYDYRYEYEYDGCGSMTADYNKGVRKILYDFNGMPTCVWFENGSITYYVYTADGVKLKTIHRTAVEGLNVSGSSPELSEQNTLSKDSTLYVGDFEIGYRLKKYYHDNMYVSFEDGHSQGYNYLVKDHLGNVRHVDRSTHGRDNGIVQITNYYPFGGILNESFNRVDYQNKLYNGKEYDRMHGLNLYDYSSRQYDAALGQFTSMDPLCEKYYHISPYAYCAGNPVKYVDPDGKAIRIQYIDTRGRVQHFVFRDTGQKGYVKVPKSRNNFVKNVVGAYYYNKRNFTKMFPGEKSGLMKLVQREDNKNTVTIKETRAENDNNYNSGLNEITWNPYEANETTSGTTNSPATILAHEGEHANNNTESVESSQAFHSRVNTSNENFENEEEKYVITGGEQKQAEANGEVKHGVPNRLDHSGKVYEVKNYWMR